jgi:hypothetical protein
VSKNIIKSPSDSIDYVPLSIPLPSPGEVPIECLISAVAFLEGENISESETVVNDFNTNRDTIIHPEVLIGNTFVLQNADDNSAFIKIVHLIKDHKDKTNDNPSNNRFTILHGHDKIEEIVSYNKLLEYI